MLRGAPKLTVQATLFGEKPLTEFPRINLATDRRGNIVDSNNGILYLNLRSGPMFSAGSRFKWIPTHQPLGCGVDSEEVKACLRHGLKIRVFLKADFSTAYEIDSNKFYELSVKYRAAMNLGGVLVWLCPLDVFKPVIGDYSDIRGVLKT